jgi:hypothetical protein
LKGRSNVRKMFAIHQFSFCQRELKAMANTCVLSKEELLRALRL